MASKQRSLDTKEYEESKSIMYMVYFTQTTTGSSSFMWDYYQTEAEAEEVAEALPGSEGYETINEAWVVER